MKKLSVIIPCFNEIATVQEIIRRVEAVDIAPWTKEIIVVDDFSTDGTRKALKAYEGKHTIIYHERNKGKGHAVRNGIDRATGDYLFIQDADLEYNPAEIPSFIKALEEGKGDCIYGSRRLGNVEIQGKWIPRIGVWVMTRFFNLFYNTRLTDLWTCYKLFAKEDGVLYPPARFEGDLLFPAHLMQRGRRIAEIPISYNPRTVQDGKKVRIWDGLSSLTLLILDWIRHIVHSHKTETAIFLFTFSVRVLFFSALLFQVFFSGAFEGEAQSIFPVLGGDSQGYVRIAENLRNYGEFSLSSTPPLFPDSFRTPGYPFFLFILLPVIGKIGVIFIQIILAAAIAVLVYKLAQRFLPKQAAVIAALLVALEPYSMFLSSLLLSETLFTFFLMLSVYLLFRSTPSFRSKLVVSAAAGVSLGLAVLTRTIGQFLIPFLALFLLLFLWRRYRMRAALAAGVFFLCATLTLLPWILRNATIFGSYQLSSVHNNLLYNNVALHYGLENNIPLDEARDIFRAQIAPGASIDELRSLYHGDESIKLALSYLREHGASYAQFHTIKMIPFFVSDGLRDMVRLLRFEERPTPNFTNLILTGKISEIPTQAIEGGYFFVLLLIGASLWVTLTLCAVVGTIFGLRRENNLVLFIGLYALLVLYFAIASTPVAPARMRVVAEPFFFTLSAYGAWEIYTRVRLFISSRKSKKGKPLTDGVRGLSKGEVS